MVKRESLRVFIWVELAIWLIIVLGVIFVIRHYKIKNVKSKTTYQIFMPDVDGLIVGSPVKFMGVEIGYIDKIKIVDNDVYVRLLITENNIQLPQGVIATTEFSGLGGSKSLELYPPTPETAATRNIIYVEPPKRIHDALGLLNQMYSKIDSISKRFSTFGAQTEDIQKNPSNSIDTNAIQQNINNADSVINNIKNIKKNSGEKHEQK